MPMLNQPIVRGIAAEPRASFGIDCDAGGASVGGGGGGAVGVASGDGAGFGVVPGGGAATLALASVTLVALRAGTDRGAQPAETKANVVRRMIAGRIESAEPSAFLGT
jgi:hypothetical protein